MATRLLAIVLVAGVASSSASAQDGGKLPWKKDPQAALEEAKRSGKATLMFFTSLG